MNHPTAVITGSLSGIGRELAIQLAGQGWRLILLNRSRQRTESVFGERLARLTQVEIYEVDLADKDALLDMATHIAVQHPRIDLLINNAAVMLDQYTDTGHGDEMHFQVNTLAPYILMQRLRPSLAASGNSAILNLVSSVIYALPSLDVALPSAPRAPFIKVFGPYAQSKLALATLSLALADSFLKDGIRIRCIDPGICLTGMILGKGMPLMLLLKHFRHLKSARSAARSIIPASKSEHYAGRGGIIIADGQEIPPPACAIDTASQQAILALCADKAMAGHPPAGLADQPQTFPAGQGPLHHD